MLVSDFTYDLPEERIAKNPPAERGTTRLLVLSRKNGEIVDSYYRNLDEFLNPGDVIILNDTRVMRARVFCELSDGRERELVVLEKHGDDAKRVMYRGKLHEGDILKLNAKKIKLNGENNRGEKKHNIADVELKVAKILGEGLAEIESNIDLNDLTEEFGDVPLPPYLHRDANENDTKRYQTVWADKMGSAAAPTASLNMTDDLIRRLEEKGVIVKYLTLHVGLGTFLPIRSDTLEGHKMHSEWFNIPDGTLDAIKAAKASGHRVVALGTTVARTLEFYGKTGKTQGEDDIFIYPGFEFTVIDALLTNYHAPKSTVLMLAAAFAGWEHLKNAYEHAIAEEYNFLSYGDSMLIC